jgi:peptidoglycan/LPS O-acetylase OafA/YrhL
VQKALQGWRFFSRTGGIRVSFSSPAVRAHRSDIQGLRAVSVLAVLLYHLGISAVPGGFVGVDVFFVISGFLISRIIYAEITTTGRFDIVRFYERRARRILPAFVVVTAVTLVAGYQYLLPHEFGSLAQAALYSVAFSANIFFYRTTDYFNDDVEHNPLLHYWSLGVEEQFYIAFPLIVLLVWRFAPKWLGRAMIALLAVSLICSELAVRVQPQAAFYLTPLRAWELLAGGLLALPTSPAVNSRLIREAMAAIGLTAVLAAVLFFTSETRFPGLTAALPVAGAVLLIWSGSKGEPTFVARLLGFRPMVHIGEWSYSLYMIHWPIIIFGGDIAPSWLLLVGSIALAWVSYRFVEQPFRTSRPLLGRRGIFAASFASCLVLAGTSLFIYSNSGLPHRLPEDVTAMLSVQRYDYKQDFQEGKCFLLPEQVWSQLDKAACLDGQVLLWGDSHAAHLFAALRDRLAKHDIRLAHASASACPPWMIGRDKGTRPNCRGFNDGIYEWVKANKPRVVILSSGWVYSARHLVTLDKTIAVLREQGTAVVIIGPNPKYTEKVPAILARRMLRSDPDTTADRSLNPGSKADAIMKSHYSGMEGVEYLSIMDTLCTETACPLTAPSGTPIQWDRSHFTREGADLAMEALFLNL